MRVIIKSLLNQILLLFELISSAKGHQLYEQIPIMINLAPLSVTIKLTKCIFTWDVQFVFMHNGFNWVIRWLVGLCMSLFLCIFHISSKYIAGKTMWKRKISCDKTLLGRVNWMSTAVLKHNSVNETIQIVSLSFGLTFELKLFAG